MPSFLRRKTVWFAAAAVLVLGGGGLVFMNQANAKKEAEAAQAVKAAPESPFVAVANGKADVEGGLIQVAARRAGIVRDVLVQEGEAVTEGQVLARLEDDEPRLTAARARAEVAQAQSQIALIQVELSTARREHERLQALAPSNFVAGQRLDQAQDTIRQAEARLAAQRAAVATAQARLNEAEYDLELSVIRAPSDGVIVRRYANPGAGASTLNVSNMFDLEPAGQRIVRAERLQHVRSGAGRPADRSRRDRRGGPAARTDRPAGADRLRGRSQQDLPGPGDPPGRRLRSPQAGVR